MPIREYALWRDRMPISVTEARSTANSWLRAQTGFPTGSYTMPRGKHPRNGRVVEIRCDPYESDESYMCALLIVRDDFSVVLKNDRRLDIQEIFERNGYSFKEDEEDEHPSERRRLATERFYDIIEENAHSLPSWLVTFEPADGNANASYDGQVTVERSVKRKTRLKTLGVVVKMSATAARKYNSYIAKIGKQNEVVTVIVSEDFTDEEILERFLNGIRGRTGIR